jgi:hypothetical protein
MQPMAYSTPADNPIVTEAQTPTRFLRTDIFSFFSPSQYMAKKERKNIIYFSKSLFRRGRVYRTISFRCQIFTTTNFFYFIISRSKCQSPFSQKR